MDGPHEARQVRVIDSHTEGEPTRVVIDGGPDLGPGDVASRLQRLRTDHDDFRSALVNEPRGFDAMVGALLGEPAGPDAVAQVIFFNNVGYLGMCVHGAIGVASTLAWMGVIGEGAHLLETPVGDVGITLLEDGRVEVQNVPSYRTAKAVSVTTRSYGTVTGDVAWGGNWFFLVSDHGQRLEIDNLESLTSYSWEVREALAAAGVRGDAGEDVDHIELFGPPGRDDADSRNFVLCPGREYDRSPCGTGTSAKMACLWADGELAPGQLWRQESIIGSLFTGRAQEVDGGVVATVAGRAWITAESSLILLPDDPFARGIRSNRSIRSTGA
jgi:4-hydroxyproline epimerase